MKPIYELLRKIAVDIETEYLSEQELSDSLNTPDDPTITSLYYSAHTNASKKVSSTFATALPKISWSSYNNPEIKNFVAAKRFKFAFKLGNTIYVNLNIKVLQKNLPSIPNALFEICTHEIAHVLYDSVKHKLSFNIDDESFADIVTKYVAPREPFNNSTAPKQFSLLQNVLKDLNKS
jgi:hypothetical protein